MKNGKPRLKGTNGFSFVELFIVMAVIAVIVSVAVPKLRGAPVGILASAPSSKP